MSLFIDQNPDQIIQRNLSETKNYSQSIKTLLQEIYSKLPTATILQSEKFCLNFCFTIYQQKIQMDLQIFVQINFALQTIRVVVYYYRNNIPLSIRANLSLGILKRFFTKISINRYQQPKISVDENSGLLRYSLKVFCNRDILNSGTIFFKFLSAFVTNLELSQSLMRKKVFQSCKLIPVVYQEYPIDMPSKRNRHIKFHANNEDLKFEMITKYVSLSALPVNASKVGDNKQFIFEQNLFKKQQNSGEIETRHLYCFDIRRQLHKVQQINYKIDQHDQIRLSKALQTNIIIPIRPGDNKYIFNFIKILQSQNVNPRPFKAGGCSIIMLANLNFQYVKTCVAMKTQQDLKKFIQNGGNINAFNRLNDQDSQQQLEQKEKIIKWICIKVPKNQAKFNQQFQRQKAIIKLFRTAHSPYFLKYYVSDQTNYKFHNNLMMDACNMPSLSQYLQAFKKILSIQTKLQILLHVIKAVVFLQRNQIVHMDLKPGNILIAPQNYLIKLIDFGEAYNEKVCSNQYFPGYSFPYSPPQGLKPLNKKFSSKSDVFSFGVMMHEILFQKRPFEYVSNLKESFTNKKYLQKMKLIHESLEDQFNDRITNLFLFLIIKCLDSDENKRPQPSWIALILYLCLNNLKESWQNR